MRCLGSDGSWVSINHLEDLELESSLYPPRTVSPTDVSYVSFSSDSSVSSVSDESDPSIGLDPATRKPIYARFPIRDYINQCALPIYEYKGKRPLLELKDQNSSMRWSTIASLGCFPLPRALKTIERYGSRLAISLSNDPYFEKYDEEHLQFQRPLTTEFRRRLLLPATDITHLEPEESERLADVQNDEELSHVFQTFVLGTATEAVRLMRYLEPDENPADRAMALRSQFQIRNNLFMDRYSLWNIFSLRDPFDRNAAPLIVVFIEPSWFGIEDFDQFVAEREINRDLDRPTVPSDIIWAVIYEALKNGKGYKFVLTNYVRWAFGLFEPEYTKASVTEVYEAALCHLDGRVRPPTNAEQGNSFMELLIRWMETPLTKKGLERFMQTRYPDYQ